MLLLGLPVPMNMHTICKIINLFLNKDVYNIYKEILYLVKCNNTDLQKILDIIKGNKFGDYYFLYKCIFVVRDLDNFINDVNKTTKNDHNANQGLSKLKSPS